MTRKWAIAGITAVGAFMVLSTIAMFIFDHDWSMLDDDWVMIAPPRFFTGTLGALLWFCIGWLCGNRASEARRAG